MLEFLGDIWHWHPPVGVWIGVLGLLGVVVPLFRDISKIGKPEKAVWTFVLFALLLLEIKTVYQDRNEDDAEQAEARAEQLREFNKIAGGIDNTIAISNQHFDGTMGNLTNLLAKEDKNLIQTMGGDGFPYFLPTYPTTVSKDGVIFPVKVAYINFKKLPLVDVSVDIMLRESKGEKTEDWARRVGGAAGSPFHPWHVNLGTILPGISESPIQLQAGNRYYFYITTRRGDFNERINIDHDDHAPEGWKLSLCLYQANSNKLLEGKCDD
jgi:hypothetical protein